MQQAIKYELGVLGAALFGLGVLVALQSAGAEQKPATPVDRFTSMDFEAFDRDFHVLSETCAVGFEAQRMCFGHSPYEASLKIGDVLAPEVPLLAAEFRVIVATDLKADELRTMRFGQTLILIDPKTRRIQDLMRLTAPDFESARKANLPVQG